MSFETKITKGPSRDIAGKRVNMLTAICVMIPADPTATDARRYNQWLTVCDCGSTRVCPTHQFNSGAHYSCGCTRRPMKLRTDPRPASYVRLKSIWLNMRNRTRNPNAQDWERYGGRGITICPEWGDFRSFHDWALANGYAPDLTIDRIDNDGGYCPSNCRWTDAKEQNRNRRSTRLDYDTANEIRRALDAGEAPMAIAERLGLADRKHLIYNIKNNGAWSAAPRNYYKETGNPAPSRAQS